MPVREFLAWQRFADTYVIEQQNARARQAWQQARTDRNRTAGG